MDENTAIEPQPQETIFLVWSGTRRIGVAHQSAGGGIVVKLDRGEVVKSGNISPLLSLSHLTRARGGRLHDVRAEARRPTGRRHSYGRATGSSYGVSRNRQASARTSCSVAPADISRARRAEGVSLGAVDSGQREAERTLLGREQKPGPMFQNLGEIVVSGRAEPRRDEYVRLQGGVAVQSSLDDQYVAIRVDHHA
jgi:hypothetical protein